eukprot:g9643.t1
MIGATDGAPEGKTALSRANGISSTDISLQYPSSRYIKPANELGWGVPLKQHTRAELEAEKRRVRNMMQWKRIHNFLNSLSPVSETPRGFEGLAEQ